MWLFEAIAEEILSALVHHGPKPVRVGCTVLLVIVIVALLTMALWVPLL